MKKDDVADYSKCTRKFSDKWLSSEAKAGPGVCPSEGDEGDIDQRISDVADTIAVLLSGMCPVDGGDLACQAVSTNECFTCMQNKPSYNDCALAVSKGCLEEIDNALCAEAINAEDCALDCCL